MSPNCVENWEIALFLTSASPYPLPASCLANRLSEFACCPAFEWRHYANIYLHMCMLCYRSWQGAWLVCRHYDGENNTNSASKNQCVGRKSDITGDSLLLPKHHHPSSLVKSSYLLHHEQGMNTPIFHVFDTFLSFPTSKGMKWLIG